MKKGNLGEALGYGLIVAGAILAFAAIIVTAVNISRMLF